jgi:hypothetical protein
MRPIIGAVLVAGMLAVASQAGAAIYAATMEGTSEDTPNMSNGTGMSLVYLDLVARTLRVTFSFMDLDGLSTVAHIHGPTALPRAGAASVMTMTPTFAGFPADVTSFSYDETFDTSNATTFNPAFVNTSGGVDAAEAAFAAALAEGRAYLNIHSVAYPGGEIRGFYSAVPLPAAIGPLLLGLLGLIAIGRGRRRSA